MRVGIIFTREVMLVIFPERRKLFQPSHDIRPQPRLVIVDKDAGRDVHRAHQHKALAQLGRGADPLDLIRYIPDFVTPLDMDRELFRHACHRACIPRVGEKSL